MEKVSIKNRIIRDPKQIYSSVDQDVVMLSLEEGRYFALNEVGARIWELLEQSIIVNDLINKLIDEFDVSKKKCELETLDILNELYQNKLIIICEQ